LGQSWFLDWNTIVEGDGYGSLPSHWELEWPGLRVSLLLINEFIFVDPEAHHSSFDDD